MDHAKKQSKESRLFIILTYMKKESKYNGFYELIDNILL